MAATTSSSEESAVLGRFFDFDLVGVAFCGDVPFLDDTTGKNERISYKCFREVIEDKNICECELSHRGQRSSTLFIGMKIEQFTITF